MGGCARGGTEPPRPEAQLSPPRRGLPIAPLGHRAQGAWAQRPASEPQARLLSSPRPLPPPLVPPADPSPPSHTPPHLPLPTASRQQPLPSAHARSNAAPTPASARLSVGSTALHSRTHSALRHLPTPLASTHLRPTPPIPRAWPMQPAPAPPLHKSPAHWRRPRPSTVSHCPSSAQPLRSSHPTPARRRSTTHVASGQPRL